MKLDPSIKQEIDRFLQGFSLPDLYRTYEWKRDTWKKGFPDLFNLEKEISKAARENTINQANLLKIADWGKLYNKNRIYCSNPIDIILFENNLPATWLKKEPDKYWICKKTQIP